MLFEKIFSGGHSSKEMHSNQYAAGSVSRRTFSERKSVEQNRSRIAAYRHSKLGFSVAPRSDYKKPELKQGSPSINQVDPRVPPQQTNFREPTSRSYNPYA